MSTHRKYSEFVLPILFLAICYFPLFLHLDKLSLAPFDESRLAVNAIEILENGNFMVPHFDGKPDMWNTKPPLMVWIQAGFMGILGPNELAVRLPAALAGLCTLFALWFFCRKELKKTWLGYLSVGVLLTTQGYVGDHVTRSGDYDALLILWMTLSVLFFFKYLNGGVSKYLYLVAGATALAVLTKSVVGLMFLPGMVVCWFIFRFWGIRLWGRDTWQGVPGTDGGRDTWQGVLKAFLLFAIIAGSWYFLREMLNPGYLAAVWENEWAGRYLNTLEDHAEPFSFYLHRVLHFDFVPWVYLLPLGIFAGLTGNPQIRRLTVLILSISIPFLLVISFSQTKLYWYDVPVYPLLAVLVGVGLNWVFEGILGGDALPGVPTEQVRSRDTWQGVPTAIATILLLIAFFGFPYKEMIEKVYHPKPEFPELQYGPFLKKISGHAPFDIASRGYHAPVLFYQKSLQRQGKNVLKVHPDNLRPGQKVVVCEEKEWEIIKEKYTFESLVEADTCCALIQIK